MIAKSRLLDELLEETRRRQDIHPHLKRMILAAVQAALQRVAPEDFYGKCHGAALGVFMILRSLRIRSTICGGTVSWLFGGVTEAGESWQTRCGFWSHNPALPTPHAWVLTEFGGLVDLTCSYYHHTYRANERGLRDYDIVPMIWMRAENFRSLPSVQYSVTAQFSDIDLARCDEMAHQMVGESLTAFWSAPWIDLALPPGADTANLQVAPGHDSPILDGPAAIEKLRQVNTWVARNSALPSGATLTMSPTSSMSGS